MCWCAVKKLLTHSLTVYGWYLAASSISYCSPAALECLWNRTCLAGYGY